RALPVLVHPTDPPGVEVMDMTKFDLSWAVGFMFDTTLCFARMIFYGFFDQYPNMKLIASHGGAGLPYLVGRFEMGDRVEIPSRRRMKRKPTDYLRHIYYDCITYDLGALQYLISVGGAEHVLFGTDWPHQVHDTKGAFANTARLLCRFLARPSPYFYVLSRGSLRAFAYSARSPDFEIRSSPGQACRRHR